MSIRSHPRDTIWPWKFKFSGQGQKYPSQHSVQLTYFLCVSHQGIQSTPVHFVPWQSGFPFPRYNLTLKIQGHRSRSQVKVRGTLVSVASSWLFQFCFTSTGPTIPKIWQIECSIGEHIWNFTEKFAKKVSDRIPPKFNQVARTRGLYLPSFVAIGWAVLTWSWGQGKICPALVAWWPWPKVTKMDTKKNFLHP